MDDSLVPPDDMPEAPASSGEVPANDLPEVPDTDLPDSPGAAQPGADYGGGAQQLVAGLEGAAQGVAGPVATFAETKLLGVNPQDIVGRAEANPWTHGIAEGAGLIGGSFIPGLGEYSLGSKIASAGRAAAVASEAARLGKVGQTAVKLAIEGGLFHASDNASKMILGQTDPEAPVSALLAGVPAATLLGGALGAAGGKAATKLQEMANGKASNDAAKWLADLGSRFDLISKHGGLEGTTEAAAEQAQHLHDTVAAAVDDGFSLKRNSIDKLTASVDPGKAAEYVNSVKGQLAGVSKELQNSATFRRAVERWDQSIAGSSKPADIFEATDNFKKDLGYLSKFDAEHIQNPDVRLVAKDARGLYASLRDSLEDKDAWGEMGEFQKQLNSAYSKIQTPLKDFTRAATQRVGDDIQVDKGKLFNVFRQLGKGKLSAEMRANKISNFFDPAREFLDTVHNLHAAQGLESNIPHISTEVLDEMLKKDLPGGSRAASWFFDAGQNAAGMAGSHVVGAAVGAGVGHPYLGYRAGEALYPLFKSIIKRPMRIGVAGALRALSVGEYSGVPAAINHAEAIKKGADKIEASVNNVFRIGGKSYFEGANEAQREALKKFVAEGQLNHQIDEEKNGGGSQMIQQTPSFAHGGEVLAPEPAPASTKSVPKVTHGLDSISRVFPEQAMLLGAAKGRINNYLNSIRPQKINAKLPFDESMPNHEHDRAYDRALDIANNPLSVLDHIKRGTIEPEQVQHLNQLYPELSNHLKKKLSEKIVDAQMKGEKPPYHIRQGLSLFMGSALDSNLTPQNIMAAQATFVVQKANAQAAAAQTSKPKRGTASLENEPNQYRTSSQSSQLRQQRVKS